MQLIELSITDIAWALGMVGIAIGLSAWQKIGLEGQLAMAAVRTVLQLILVGYVLAVVFAPEGKNPGVVLLILGVMLTTATVVARNRISKKMKGLLPLVCGSIFVSTLLTLAYTHWLVIRPTLWYEPQYLIPLAGIVIGNGMNAAALAGERLMSTLNSSQMEIETQLSLGATPQQAVTQYRKDAIKVALIPTLNQMIVIGIVTLPGTITGQLLSGVSPLNAIAYQMLIMFMLAFANIVTTLLMTQGLCQKCFNEAAQFQSSG